MLQALLHFHFYRLFNKTPHGALLCQCGEASLDIEKKNLLLCQHCCRELNALSKHLSIRNTSVHTFAIHT